MLSLRQNKKSSFPGHAPGKDTLRAANAATKEGANGGENRISEANSVVFPSFSERGLTGENARANAVSRRALSPVKRKWDSRGENNRTSFLRSKVVVFPSFPESGVHGEKTE